jgi:hypothetical protein
LLFTLAITQLGEGDFNGDQLRTLQRDAPENESGFGLGSARNRFEALALQKPLRFAALASQTVRSQVEPCYDTFF